MGSHRISAVASSRQSVSGPRSVHPRRPNRRRARDRLRTRDTLHKSFGPVLGTLVHVFEATLLSPAVSSSVPDAIVRTVIAAKRSRRCLARCATAECQNASHKIESAAASPSTLLGGGRAEAIRPTLANRVLHCLPHTLPPLARSLSKNKPRPSIRQTRAKLPETRLQFPSSGIALTPLGGFCRFTSARRSKIRSALQPSFLGGLWNGIAR